MWICYALVVSSGGSSTFLSSRSLTWHGIHSKIKYVSGEGITVCKTALRLTNDLLARPSWRFSKWQRIIQYLKYQLKVDKNLSARFQILESRITYLTAWFCRATLYFKSCNKPMSVGYLKSDKSDIANLYKIFYLSIM